MQIKNIIWRIEGPFDTSYSLALLNRELARAMNKLGVNVILHSTEGPGDYAPHPIFLYENKDIARMCELANKVEGNEVSVASRNLYPPRVEDMNYNCNILHSYAWEETAFPHKWAMNFNQYLDGLTCLSHHVMKTMIDNGVFVPLAVSGCGVDHWERIPATTLSPLDGIETCSFRFLHVSSFFPRKGPSELLAAFGQAFTGEDDVCLVIKTFPNPHNNVHQQLDAARRKYHDYPQVILIEEDISDAELKALYLKCQVLVAPSCAEGFGLPLAEAMLAGLPVITTAWSGQLDFCNKQNAWLVDYCFRQADTHFKLSPSAWAIADIDQLACAMLTAFHSSEKVRYSMAQKGRALLLENFTWEKVAERLIKFYQKLRVMNPIREAKVGWITSWNTKCGIATYSSHLITGFKVCPVIFAARDKNIVLSDAKDVYRCWNIGTDDRLLELSSIISKQQLDVLVIQFNFGFYHHDNLFRFIEEQKGAGRIVIVDMHATIDPPQAPDKKLIHYLSALMLADRLLVHSCADMNRLKLMGIDENMVLFPHGVINSQVAHYAAISTESTIATYGFCLPHKGLEQILEAIHLLKKEGVVVNLRMVNAAYPNDISLNLIEQLRQKICRLGLGDQVMLETGFLSDEESLALLSGSDLVLFAYSPTSESASGAVRYGLACGRPTMVTNLPIFEELGESVWRIEDNAPSTLVNGIRQTLYDIKTGSPVAVEKQRAAQQWLYQHTYSLLSERLQGMLQGLFVQKTFFHF